MFNAKNPATKAAWILIPVLVVLFIGCSRFEAPTASQPTTESGSTLWNPQPGDRIGGGETPIVNGTYWESLYGQQINPAATSASKVIGPEGGTLRLGPHRLDVPPMAVSGNVTFTMSYASMTGIGVDCGPSPYTFNIPVQLTLSYANTQYDPHSGNAALTPASLAIFYQSTTGAVEEMPSTVDQNGMRVTASVGHFSRYIIAGRLTF
jgi:hypothetical protein